VPPLRGEITGGPIRAQGENSVCPTMGGPQGENTEDHTGGVTRLVSVPVFLKTLAGLR